MLSVLHRNFVSVCIPLSFPKQQMQENHMHDLKRAPVLEVHHSCNEEKGKGGRKVLDDDVHCSVLADCPQAAGYLNQDTPPRNVSAVCARRTARVTVCNKCAV